MPPNIRKWASSILKPKPQDQPSTKNKQRKRWPSFLLKPKPFVHSRCADTPNAQRTPPGSQANPIFVAEQSYEDVEFLHEHIKAQVNRRRLFERVSSSSNGEIMFHDKRTQMTKALKSQGLDPSKMSTYQLDKFVRSLPACQYPLRMLRNNSPGRMVRAMMAKDADAEGA